MSEKRYRTIVADPPWDYRYTSLYAGDWEKTKAKPSMPYPTLTVEEITSLPVPEMAERDSHLYLWTTQRYLRDAFTVMDTWGFNQAGILVWAKPPRGFVGTFVCATEFVIFARRGTLAAKTRIGRNWWEWPRGEHSAKPEAFLDLVEQVSPGPYLELFARRQRLGWDTWGNECFEHVEMDGAA